MLERIGKVSNTIREAQNQDHFMDGQEPTTNIELENCLESIVLSRNRQQEIRLTIASNYRIS